VRTLLLAVSLLLVAPGVAVAAPIPGDYGGGAVRANSELPGTSWMWARVGADGRARVGGAASLACGLGRFDAEVVPAADGSFVLSRVRRGREGGHRLRAVVTVRGRFDGSSASGTVNARLRNVSPNGRVRRCSTSGARPWTLRMRAAPGAPAPAQARAVYSGLTDEPGPVPRPFLLRTSNDGTRVAVAIFEYTRRCRRGSFFLNNFTPNGTIRADGTFAMRERFTLRYRGGIRERFRIRVDGQFTAGGVAGGLRVSTVVRRRGRAIDRCDTGALTFGALL
jgi:hypothetical protein